MMLTVTCSACRKSLQLPATAAGRQCRCPSCHTVISVPVAAPARGEAGQIVSGPPPLPGAGQLRAGPVPLPAGPVHLPPMPARPAWVAWLIVGLCLLLVVLPVGAFFYFVQPFADTPEEEPVIPPKIVNHTDNSTDAPKDKPHPQVIVVPRPNFKPKPIWEGHRATVWTVAFSRSGQHALSGGGSLRPAQGEVPDNSVRLWNAFTGQQLKCLDKFQNTIKTVAFSPDGHYAILGSAGKWVGQTYIPAPDHSVRLWDIETDRELTKIVVDNSGGAPQKQSVPRFQGLTDEVWCVALSPDGKLALGGCRNWKMILWDVATGKERFKFEGDAKGLNGHANGIYGVAFAPDSRRFLSCAYDHTLRLWSAETGEHLRCFRGHTDIVWSVAFSPDGKYALSGAGGEVDNIGNIRDGTKDFTLRLWDVNTGAEVRQFKGHTHAIWGVAFSPDGRRILSGGVDQTVRFWDTATGAEIQSFRGHTGAVRSVAISPDGLYGLSGSDDHTVRSWELPKQ